MTNITTFSFENHSIRVVQDKDGTPWFNAKDICDALGYENARQSVIDHVDKEDVSKRYTLTHGGRQLVNHVNESGMYALILGSNKEEARMFKRWITAEVLPTIRKTGTYSLPGKQARALTKSLMEGFGVLYDIVRKVPGVQEGVAMAAMLNAIKINTGVEVDPFRLALPPETKTLAGLNATKLGERLGMSAQAVNKILEAEGYQVKNGRGEWELTEQGKQYGEALPYSNGNHSGYQILWRPEIEMELFELAGPAQ